MKYTYEQIIECVNALGISNTFTSDALMTLNLYSDAPEDVIFGLIQVLGENAFTDEAKDFLKRNEHS